MRIRRYSELRRFETLEDRFQYLRLDGDVGRSTFGFDRYINQKFYQSSQWKHARQMVIVRDMGCDLGVRGYEINGGLVVHHMNPMSIDDIVHGEDWILDPDFLICTTTNTHNAIHYGDETLLKREFVERKPGDTKLW